MNEKLAAFLADNPDLIPEAEKLKDDPVFNHLVTSDSPTLHFGILFASSIGDMKRHNTDQKIFSQIFAQGLVTYASAAKIEALNVMLKFPGVSSETFAIATGGKSVYTERFTNNLDKFLSLCATHLPEWENLERK